MDTTWRMRLGHGVVHEWEWQSALPSAPGCSREGRGPTEQGDTHDTWLKRKNPTIGGGRGLEYVPGEKLRN